MDRPRVDSNVPTAQSAVRNVADKDYRNSNSSSTAKTSPSTLNVPGITSPWGKNNHTSDAQRVPQMNAPVSVQSLSPSAPSAAAAVVQPEPVKRASNFDLQSQLRDLLKCGSSSNTNPFAPKRDNVPPTVSLQGESSSHFLLLFLSTVQ